MWWHIYSAAFVLLSVSSPGEVPASDQPDSAVPMISSRSMEIAYQVPSQAYPLQRVELWITRDSGQSWRSVGLDEDLHPPFAYTADGDGHIGLFFVITNMAGASSAAPEPGTQPHHSIRVDSTDPLIQLQQVKIMPVQPQSHLLSLAWTAYDANLGQRPMAIFFQRQEETGWHLLADNVENNGRFDWPIPDQLRGHVQVKIQVTDQAGHQQSAISNFVLVSQANTATNTLGSEADISVAQATPILTGMEEIVPTSQPATTPSGSVLDVYKLGLWHKERGDYGQAINQFLECINTAPEFLPAAYELANIYYAENNYQGAMNIYKNILDRYPEDRDALRGCALTQVALKQYSKALVYMDKVLLKHPEDAQTWLDTGDVFVWMGERESAKKYWSEARRLSQKNPTINTAAQKRLEKLVSTVDNK
ncbi:MAG: hypothetical protein HJJLKODD_00359 [Phycisphaerae bacterium]|nr:hypothetical protein [Phycisphaerae bacterium]